MDSDRCSEIEGKSEIGGNASLAMEGMDAPAA